MSRWWLAGGMAAVLVAIMATQWPVTSERPRLTVDPSCSNACREFESYEWKPDTDEPVKINDHAMDAIRYAVMHIDAGTPIGSVAITGERERRTKPVSMADLRKDPDWGFN